jgi:hypothetical protein
MSDYIIIDSIDSLCVYIMNTKPTLNHVNQIIWNMGIKSIIMNEASPEEYCKLITDFWAKWKEQKERPIFIDYEAV